MQKLLSHANARAAVMEQNVNASRWEHCMLMAMSPKNLFQTGCSRELGLCQILWWGWQHMSISYIYS